MALPGEAGFGRASVRQTKRRFGATQKAEAVERFRDGIVHDLNNRFMVISANVDAVARHMKDQPLLQRKLLSALVASDQAATLLARSTAFADSTVRMCRMSNSESGSSPSPP